MLQEKIQQDLITAMKNRDEAKLSVLRMLQAAIKNKKIERVAFSKIPRPILSLQKDA